MKERYFDFTDKVVMITGGSRGLGHSMALAFAERGADIIVSSRKLESCEQVAEKIRSMGRRALAVSAHMGDWEQISSLVDQAYARFGRVDVLINNAGMSPLSESMDQVSEDLFDKVTSVNFKGPFRLATLVGRRMSEEEGGAIINVSSIGAQMPSPYFGPYAGAKAALNAVSTALAIEYAPKVRVNVISPGGFLTDIAGDWAEDPEGLAGVPMGRFAQPEEIVTTALYLASEYSSFTTNANIRVDGGCRFVKI